MAHRYGRWPHEVLELDPWALGILRIAYEAGDALADLRVQQLQRAGGGLVPMPVPVVVVR